MSTEQDPVQGTADMGWTLPACCLSLHCLKMAINEYEEQCFSVSVLSFPFCSWQPLCLASCSVYCLCSLLCLLDACVGFVLDKSLQNKDETKGRTTSEVNSGLAIFMQGNITFSAKHRQSWKQMLPILVGFDSRV